MKIHVEGVERKSEEHAWLLMRKMVILFEASNHSSKYFNL